MEIIFGVHNHQPYGNFPDVYESTYQEAYLPFIEEVLKNNAKVVLHFTGTLLEWIEKNHKEYIDKVRKLLKESRAEILSGGYYEPIMPAIPSEFRVKQIKKLNKLIYDIFSYKPKGLWLAERVWELNIIPDLKEAEMEYTFLDEENFLSINKKSDRYYTTEYDGIPFKIFVIDKKLRYLIPFKDQEETIEHLKSGRFLVAFDDGEKFGAWPGTYKLSYESKWLEKLFNSFKQQNVKMILPQQIYENNDYCGGLAYIDSGSYPEMLSWALPVDKRKEGYKCNWKNFFVKYPESNYMHKLNLINCKHCDSEECEDDIMASQANDAYWHGVFGGIYISHLRSAIYNKILSAQKKLKDNLIIEDVDFDGQKEIILKNDKMIIGVDPDAGGRIFELGTFEKNYNFQNTLTRRRESYHEEDIIEDWYDKFSLIDHFLEFPSFHQIKSCHFHEIGDFVNSKYDFFAKDNKISLKREGNIWFRGKHTKITLKKEICLEDDHINIEYYLINPNDFDIPFHFAVEFNFNFVSEYGNDRYINYNEKKYSVGKDYNGEIKTMEFRDEYFDLGFGMEFEKSQVWSYPIKTTAMSEKDKVESYQGTSIFVNKIDTLEKKGQKTLNIQIKIK